MNDLTKIDARLQRIEELLERICPPIEMLDVRGEADRIRKMAAAKYEKKQREARK